MLVWGSRLIWWKKKWPRPLARAVLVFVTGNFFCERKAEKDDGSSCCAYSKKPSLQQEDRRGFLEEEEKKTENGHFAHWSEEEKHPNTTLFGHHSIHLLTNQLAIQPNVKGWACHLHMARPFEIFSPTSVGEVQQVVHGREIIRNSLLHSGILQIAIAIFSMSFGHVLLRIWRLVYDEICLWVCLLCLLRTFRAITQDGLLPLLSSYTRRICFGKLLSVLESDCELRSFSSELFFDASLSSLLCFCFSSLCSFSSYILHLTSRTHFVRKIHLELFRIYVA